jgi:aminoglycoside 3-N-acetyltransferase
MKVTKERIIEVISHYGIQRGDVVALQSSLSSLGEVEGGADTVVNAFTGVLGDRGTLIVPTFTYSFKHWNDYQPFNLLVTPSQCGAISEAVRLRPEAIRSNHPTHSVAAIGFFAREMVKDHVKCAPLGKGSPYHKLSQIGGFIVLMGVGQDRNPLIHTCESLAQVPYLCVSWSNTKTGIDIARVADDSGNISELEVKEVPGCSRGFVKAETVLRERGVIQYTKLGNSNLQVMKAENVVDIILEKLNSDPFFLLCDDKECPICTRRRKYGKAKPGSSPVKGSASH